MRRRSTPSTASTAGLDEHARLRLAARFAWLAELCSGRCRGVDRVAQASPSGPAEHRGEARRAQAALEGRVGPLRPDRIDAARGERGARRREHPGPEAGIADPGAGSRTVVEVEQDRVEAGGVARGRGEPDPLAHVAQLDRDAGIQRRAARERRQHAPAPGDDTGMQLSDADARRRRQQVQRRPQRETHPQAPDQQARARACGEPRARRARQRLLGAVCGGAHQHAAGEQDQEVALAAAAELERSIGRLHALECHPGARQSASGLMNFARLRLAARFACATCPSRWACASARTRADPRRSPRCCSIAPSWS